MMFCKECGARVTADARYCEMCGSAVKQASVDAEPAIASKGRKAGVPKWAVWIALGVVVLAVAGIVAGMLSLRTSTPSDTHDEIHRTSPSVARGRSSSTPRHLAESPAASREQSMMEPREMGTAHWTRTKIDRYLDRAYPGWKFAKPDCHRDGARKRNPSMISGDFNGDNLTDFAYQISTDQGLKLLAFVSPDKSYKLADRQKWAVPIVRKPKGTKYYDNESDSNGSLANDAVAMVFCEEGGWTYVYSGGQFKKLSTTD